MIIHNSHEQQFKKYNEEIIKKSITLPWEKAEWIHDPVTDLKKKRIKVSFSNYSITATLCEILEPFYSVHIDVCYNNEPNYTYQTCDHYRKGSYNEVVEYGNDTILIYLIECITNKTFNPLVNNVEYKPVTSKKPVKVKPVPVKNKLKNEQNTNNSTEITDKRKLICILGQTCSGKDSIANALVKNYGHKTICSYTTRPKRDNEVEGREHYFVTDEEFNKLLETHTRDIIAYTQIGDYRYLALFDEILTKDIYIIDPQGFQYLKDNFGDVVDLYPYFINRSLPEIIVTAREKRSDYNTEFKKRLLAEIEQFTDFLMNTENKIKIIDNHQFHGDTIESCASLIESDFKKIK